MAPGVQQHIENTGRGSIALGAGIMLVGILLGFVWAWLTFFHHSKSPRNGMTSNSGQVSKQVFRPIHFASNFILPEAICSLVCFGAFVSLSYVRVAMRKDVGRFESINWLAGGFHFAVRASTHRGAKPAEDKASQRSWHAGHTALRSRGGNAHVNAGLREPAVGFCWIQHHR